MTAELEELEWDEQELAEEEEAEAMPTLEHAAICNNLNSEINRFLKGKNLGRAFDSTAEYRFLKQGEDRPSKAGKQPDVSFVRQEKLPARLRSYPNIVPDLVVEVESPSDKGAEIEAKVALYQAHGVKLVWVVHYYSRRVDVYRLADGLIPEPIGMRGELDGEAVIAGFKLAVADIFDYPADPDPAPER